MQKRDAKQLLENYCAGLCTEEEKAMVENWYLTIAGDGAAPSHKKIMAAKSAIWKSIGIGSVKKNRFLFGHYLSAAAVFIICLAMIFYFSHSPEKALPDSQKTVKYDFGPGANRATLILSDDREVILDEVATGDIAGQPGMKITKSAGGQIIYDVEGQHGVKDDLYNTIVTPRGGQYQVNLADGTRVWLNASSMLRFPVTAENSRSVELTGEAYFEVAKSAGLPFEVFTAEQKVVVLGTHFNINCYADEGDTKTTLIEGSVMIRAKSRPGEQVLRPGQQSALQNGKLSISAVDPADMSAWKNGLFVFNNETLESIMRKVARWYNVSVVYEDDALRQEVFGGSVSRFGKVSEILKMLEITGHVHFDIRADRIVVMKINQQINKP